MSSAESVSNGPPPEPVTIARVANLAGVSQATVSRVMNGSPTVAPELARRVREAAGTLKYRPSVVARSLALGRTTTIAIVVPDLANPMFQEVLRGLSHAAAEQGHRLLVADSHEDPDEEPALAEEARRRCDGVVLCAPRMSADRLRELAPRLAPMVLVNRDVPGLSTPALCVDHAAGVADLADHLIDLGHRRLAYLAGPTTSASNHERLTGLHRAARGRVEVVEIPCGSGFADGHGAARQVAESGATAVIAYNDLAAFGALSGLHKLGIRVPEEISIAGFDDIPFARYTTPPLTTMSVPQGELGHQAWRRLWALLNDEPPEHNVYFRPRLEVRGSTAPPPTASPRP